MLFIHFCKILINILWLPCGGGGQDFRGFEAKPKIKSKQTTLTSTDNKIKLFYRLYVLHNDIPQNYQDLLQETLREFSDFSSLSFINADNELSSIWDSLGFRGHFSKEFLYKLLLTTHFREYDKIIVSDVDVVFLGDVSMSFLDFSCDDEIYISGIKANNPEAIFPLIGWKEGYKKYTKDEFEAIKYGIGAGYFIANLKAWRKDDLESKLVQYALKNANKLILAEQDVLNIICYPKIGSLSPQHMVGNAMWEIYGEDWGNYKPKVYSQKELDNARDNPIQLHYVGDKKPWNSPKQAKSHIWYEYLSKTPFLKIHLENLEDVIINNYIKTTLSYRIKSLLNKHPLFFLDVRFYIRMMKKIYKKMAT